MSIVSIEVVPLKAPVPAISPPFVNIIGSVPDRKPFPFNLPEIEVFIELEPVNLPIPDIKAVGVIIIGMFPLKAPTPCSLPLGVITVEDVPDKEPIACKRALKITPLEIVPLIAPLGTTKTPERVKIVVMPPLKAPLPINRPLGKTEA